MIEKAFIHELLSDSKSISQLNKFKSEFCERPETRIIYDSISNLYELGEEVSYKSVSKESGVKIIDLREYKNETETFNIRELAAKITDKYLWRKLNDIYTTARKEKNAFEFLPELQTETENLLEEISGVKDTDKNFLELLEKTVSEIKEEMESDKEPGLQLKSLPSMNNIIGGIMPVDLIGIYGREKTTKSTLAHEILMDIGVDQKIPCGMFSYEVWLKQLIIKSISLRTGFDMISLRNPKGKLDSYLLGQLTEKIRTKLMGNKDIYFCDQLLNEKQIFNKIKKWKRRYGIRLVVIDHLLLVPCSRKFKDYRNELNYLTRFFKLSAKELQVPIILVSQANDSGDRGAEAKGLERDADYFFSVHALDKGDSVKIINTDGIETEYRADVDEYVVKNRGMRFGASKRSFIVKFINNQYREINGQVGDFERAVI